ncbi:MAG: N-formylglutamate amidohydrolase [Bacteroidales bacterium]|nr:N-formylglutamate amidohydrolase [Bacteroidales bacterium]
MKNYSNIILHIPHASRNLPDSFFKNKEGKELLLKESSSLIDYFTDELFRPHSANDRRFIMLVPDYCRTLCDVERLRNDPLESRGMGILYGKGKKRSRFALKEGVDNQLLAYYDDYHAKAAEIIRSCPFPIIIDCHSFSSHSTELVTMTPEMAAIDICLGFNDDKSCPPAELINQVQEYFTGKGYKVALNRPFSNSKTFDTGGHPCHSLMIEVNKRLYMDEEKTEIKQEPFNKLRNDLMELYSIIKPRNISEMTAREFAEWMEAKSPGSCTELLSMLNTAKATTTEQTASQTRIVTFRFIRYPSTLRQTKNGPETTE